MPAGRAHPAYLTTFDSRSELRTWPVLVFIVVVCDEIGEGPKASFYRPEAGCGDEESAHTATAPCDMRGTPAGPNEASTSKVEMLGTHADVNPEK